MVSTGTPTNTDKKMYVINVLFTFWKKKDLQFLGFGLSISISKGKEGPILEKITVKNSWV